MRFDEMRAEFARLSDEQGMDAFDDLPDKPSPARDLCAFLKLEQLLPEDRYDMVTCAEHDQIWLNVNVKALARVVTLNDIAYLSACGVWLDEETDSLSMFV